MALDLNQSNVTLDNPIFVPMLTNLQANILKGHGRNFANHLFFTFDATKIDLAKSWIASFAATSVTSAKKQLEDTANLHAGFITDGGIVCTLSLTSTGYTKLGILASRPDDPSFVNGLKNTTAPIGDDVTAWEEAFTATLDMLIIVADDDKVNATSRADAIVRQVSPFATLAINQKGNVLKMASGIGIEHFGYADGISQPLYIANDISYQASTNEWNDKTNLNLLLVPDLAAEEADSFGSYLVFRKLEQDVLGFKTAEGDNQPIPGVLPLIKDVSGADNKDLAGAMIVGRFESSVPVIKSSIDIQSNPPKITNDFDYSDDIAANKCPFHSHIRLMNPRNGDAVAGDVSSRRITRRGIPFDEVERIPDDKINYITDEMLQNNQPAKGVGLLFMCYQNSIADQFEILQAFWTRGNIVPHNIGMEDSLISQGPIVPKTLPSQWGQPAQTASFLFGKFVTMKGGEYFFTPSISFLKKLNTTL